MGAITHAIGRLVASAQTASHLEPDVELVELLKLAPIPSPSVEVMRIGTLRSLS
jgi:hypothetical protein